MLAWEQANNPDDAEYGFRDLTPECLAQIPPFLLPFVGPHGGAIDTHVYGSLMLKDVTYVADAGANACSRSTRRGLDGLPPSSLVATADRRVVRPARMRRRSRFITEPVPTDVELGNDGCGYVTAARARGREPRCARRRVPREPDNGRGAAVRSGSPVRRPRVAPNGRCSVAELFGNRVSVITKRGEVSTFVDLPSPAGIEWQSGRLYVSTDVFGDGKVVSIGLR